MTKSRFALAALLAVTALSSHASLVSVDWNAVGDGLLTEDTATGLEWLDWSVTVGQTVGNAVAAHPGFRSATSAEFNTLLSSAGLANGNAYVPSQLAAAKAFVTLFNTAGTACQITNPNSAFACGYFDSENGSSNPIRIANVGWVQTAGGFASDNFGGFSPSISTSSYGVLLVRDAPASIPEPASLALVSAALLGVAATRKRKSAVPTA